MAARGFNARRHFGPFIGKRLLRLEPAYLASVALCLGLLYLPSMAPGFQGDQPDVSIRKLLLHVAYLNAILDEGWLNPVYWTLAIEFQYYLMIALVFPLLSSNNSTTRKVCLVGFIALCAAGIGKNFLPSWTSLFACGIIPRWLHSKWISLPWYFVLLAFTVLVTMYFKGAPIAITGLLTSLVIVFIKTPKSTAVFWVGALSYSTYLLHVPIGGRVMNLAGRLEDGVLRDVLALAVAVLVSLAAAFVWYLVFERPSQLASSRIRYRE
ncbi:MAG: peptidoglycan/LPS O-acetylase OafA/YrhL [Candidatus Azotimanducaceae bacterium]|jgi:peptidoglycan/LPS O-acetylase OafA/YrhL